MHIPMLSVSLLCAHVSQFEWVSVCLCVYAVRAHWILSTAVKCLCYEVIIAHDLHTHILRYSPIMYLKNKRIKCKKPIMICMHADVVWFSRFLAGIRFTHHDDNMNRIIIFVSFSFISLFTARATKKRKPNWIENTYSINAFVDFCNIFSHLSTLTSMFHHTAIQGYSLPYISPLGLCCLNAKWKQNEDSLFRRFFFSNNSDCNKNVLIIMRWFPSGWFKRTNKRNEVGKKTLNFLAEQKQFWNALEHISWHSSCNLAGIVL